MPKHFKENGNDCKERKGRGQKQQESRMRREISMEKMEQGKRRAEVENSY